ncbi:protein of unknown function DUF881 [Ammonifex degensii KC4]|uniref:DUF881 domain-containing protein n=1 Tax=Ammonifex degensii (strain DSM 10501 / KC4) TaxID=429009 RepID=C9R8M3_AMMDK|nr:DUF881 domain-containing protein [Ammonifex degensii]ACX52652.1 protein of unknown function DUF881 [Ammonifex degensii KC4]
MKKKELVSLGLIALVLGFLLAFTYRTANRVERTVPYDRAHELTLELKALAKERADLEAQARDLRAKLAKAKQGYTEAQLALEAEVKEAAALAGAVPLEGPGVRVVVDNPPGTAGGTIFAVRDEDLLKVVNELRAAGAEAISINGQRLVSTSEIRTAGSFINVNLQRITPPYEILAIGDPAALKASLEVKGGIVETLRDWGVRIQIETWQQVRVPALSKSLHFDYARAVETGGKS